MSTAERVLELDGFEDGLIAAVRGISGLGAEWSRPPYGPTGDDEPDLPYAILHAIPYDSWTGAADADQTEVAYGLQVTTVGATLQQASFNAGRVRRVLVGFDPLNPGSYITNLDVAGVHVMYRRSTAAPADDADASLVSVIERFAFYLTAV